MNSEEDIIKSILYNEYPYPELPNLTEEENKERIKEVFHKFFTDSLAFISDKTVVLLEKAEALGIADQEDRLEIVKSLAIKIMLYLASIDTEIYEEILECIKEFDIVEQCLEHMIIDLKKEEKTNQLPIENIEDFTGNLRQPKSMIYTIDSYSEALKELSQCAELEIKNKDGDLVSSSLTFNKPIYEFRKNIHTDERLFFPAEITAFDKLVLNVISSWYASDLHVFTASQVCRALRGYPNTEKINKGQIQKVEQAINKLKHAEGSIRGFIGYDEDGMPMGNLKGNLIVLLEYDVQINEHTTEHRYRIESRPFLLNLAIATNQLIRYPLELLDTRKHLPNKYPNAEIICIELVKWLHILKNPNNKHLSRQLTYKKLFFWSGITTRSRTEQNRLRTIVKKICDSFIDKGFITGYEEYSQGRTKQGIKFFL